MSFSPCSTQHEVRGSVTSPRFIHLQRSFSPSVPQTIPFFRRPHLAVSLGCLQTAENTRPLLLPPPDLRNPPGTACGGEKFALLRAISDQTVLVFRGISFLCDVPGAAARPHRWFLTARLWTRVKIHHLQLKSAKKCCPAAFQELLRVGCDSDPVPESSTEAVLPRWHRYEVASFQKECFHGTLKRRRTPFCATYL